jgi:hypothetical protein
MLTLGRIVHEVSHKRLVRIVGTHKRRAQARISKPRLAMGLVSAKRPRKLDLIGVQTRSLELCRFVQTLSDELLGNT